ncbi:MAG TPA: hypothetical protein VGE63_02940 [Candidatus Paceibacterota bacterium]
MITEEIKKINDKINAQSLLDAGVYQGVGWLDATLEICHRHGFSEEDSLELVREVGYLLLGVSSVESFFNEARTRTSLSEASIRTFCNDFEREVLRNLTQGYKVIAEMSDTEIKKLKEAEPSEQVNHILVVPIKEKGGESHTTISVPIASEKPVQDPYREAISD